MSRLPTCALQYPTCGACGTETSHDGERIYCDLCDLSYGNGDDCNEAEFLDDTADPCGKPCLNKWHDNNGRTYFKCEPCALPDTHRDDCWHPCECVAVPKEDVTK